MWSYPWSSVLLGGSGPADCSKFVGISMHMCLLQNMNQRTSNSLHQTLRSSPILDPRDPRGPQGLQSERDFQSMVQGSDAREQEITACMKRCSLQSDPESLIQCLYHNCKSVSTLNTVQGSDDNLSSPETPDAAKPTADEVEQHANEAEGEFSVCMKQCTQQDNTDNIIACLYERCKLNNVSDDAATPRATLQPLHKRSCGQGSRKRCSRSRNSKRKRRWGDAITTCINSHCSALDQADRFECIVNKCNKERRRSGN